MRQWVLPLSLNLLATVVVNGTVTNSLQPSCSAILSTFAMLSRLYLMQSTHFHEILIFSLCTNSESACIFPVHLCCFCLVLVFLPALHHYHAHLGFR